LLDTDFIGRTCGEVDGLDWDYDANVIFEVEQTDYDNDGITYWQETHVYNNSISPEVKNDRYAVIVGAGASCKLRQKSNIGSWDYPYKGTYLRYDRGYGWTDYTLYVDLMTIERFPDGDKEDIGVMFGYQDPDNYYLLRWEENDYGDDRMLLWKFVDGVRTELHDPVYTDLKENQWYTLKIKLVGNYITVDKYKNRPLDGHIYLWERIFNVYDSSLSHGSIALFTWRNRGARFDDILVKKPDGDILLSEGFDYGRIDEWTAVDEASGSSQWELTPLSVDQEDFYIQPDFVYRVLRLVAHYDKNHIVYLSADKYRDADGDGTNDVNGVSMKGSVEYLINDWLDERSDSNDLNLIYIFDHGNYDEVKETSYIAIDSDRDGYAWDSLLNPDSWPIDTNSFIYDYDVEGWLPYYGDGGIGRLTFIVEACYIGHFIDALSHQGQNRIIMPSTTKDASASGDTGSDWPAFSHALFKEMASGDTNFADAFNEADRHVEEENFLSIEIGQDPKLDDNGDKKGSDYPLPDPETKDGYLAAKTGL
jgi:hypothetical protein